LIVRGLGKLDMRDVTFEGLAEERNNRPLTQLFAYAQSSLPAVMRPPADCRGWGDAAVLRCRLKVTVRADISTAARALAKPRRLSMSQLIERLVERALRGIRIRRGAGVSNAEMTILIAAELGLKLIEASIPGGVTMAHRLAEDAARTAIDRPQLVETAVCEDADL
jgi:hypothetical protein